MNTTGTALGYKAATTVLSAVCLIQSYWLHCALKESVHYDADLQGLTLRLQKGGLNCRAVSNRQDGLLVEALYLTQTTATEEEVRRLAVDQTWESRWVGTVKVFFDPKSAQQLVIHDRPDLTYRFGPFLFFGDSHIIRRIADLLNSNESA